MTRDRKNPLNNKKKFWSCKLEDCQVFQTMNQNRFPG